MYATRADVQGTCSVYSIEYAVSYRCDSGIYTKISIVGRAGRAAAIFARSALSAQLRFVRIGKERGNSVVPPAEKSICFPGFRLSRDLEVGKTIRRWYLVLGRAESRNVFHSFGRHLLVCHDETS